MGSVASMESHLYCNKAADRMGVLCNLARFRRYRLIRHIGGLVGDSAHKRACSRCYGLSVCHLLRTHARADSMPTQSIRKPVIWSAAPIHLLATCAETYKPNVQVGKCVWAT